VKSAESYRKVLAYHETHPEVDDVAYRPGVYKALMDRMDSIKPRVGRI
jgi:hypothetical protein